MAAKAYVHFDRQGAGASAQNFAYRTSMIMEHMLLMGGSTSLRYMWLGRAIP
jgi:hypothetical protein